MLKYSFIFAALFFMTVDFGANAAEATATIVTSPAKIRGDGVLIDDDGLILGIRNLEDPRNTDYIFFFYGVDAYGSVSEESMYSVYQNPEVSWPDYIMETLVPVVEDYSDALIKSSNMQNIILESDGKLFFNGELVESGDVVNGGIVTYVDGNLYFNGEEIESGVGILNGEVVR